MVEQTNKNIATFDDCETVDELLAKVTAEVGGRAAEIVADAIGQLTSEADGSVSADCDAWSIDGRARGR